MAKAKSADVRVEEWFFCEWGKHEVKSSKHHFVLNGERFPKVGYMCLKCAREFWKLGRV